MIGEDGRRFISKELQLSRSFPSRMSGDIAYGCAIETAKARDQPELMDITQFHNLHYWVERHRYVEGDRLRNGQPFNIVNACVDQLGAVNIESAGGEELLSRVHGWDSRLHALLQLVGKGWKGPLITVRELQTWTDVGNNFATQEEDAAHASPPCL